MFMNLFLYHYRGEPKDQGFNDDDTAVYFLLMASSSLVSNRLWNR